MQIDGKGYFQASLQRMQQAQALRLRGDAYALAMYSAGVAVECMLRAFRWQFDSSFDGRHDIGALLKASGILGVDDEFMQRKGWADEEIQSARREFRGAVNEVVVLWHNNLRFASEARLKAYLVAIDRVQGIRGDPLEKNAKDLVDAAQRIVDRGNRLWHS